MPKQYHHIAHTHSVALLENEGAWPFYNDNGLDRQSDDYEYIMVQGDLEDPVMSFDSYQEMTEWAYAHGWTKPEVTEDV